MNIKNLFLGLAAIAVAIAEAAKAFASTIGDESPEAAAQPQAQPQAQPASGEDKPKRGRPAGSAAPKEAAAPAGPTDEERFAKNRDLIKPLVDGGQGKEVKAIIGKYSTTGLKDLTADHQAAFEKDIEALSY